MAERSERPPRKRGAPVGAALIVVVGVLLLLQTTGVLPWDVWSNLWRFWPVLLIAVGLNVLLGRRIPWLAVTLTTVLLAGAVGAAAFLTTTDEPSVITRLAEPLGDAESAEVEINFGAGVLLVDSLPESSPNLVEGRFEGRDAKVDLTRVGDTVTLDISMESSRFFHQSRDVNWSISLSQTTALSLDLNGGAGEIILDLRDLQTENVSLNLGAGDFKITVPNDAGTVRIDVNAGAANIRVVVPNGVAARISRTCFACSFDVDASRFPKSGDVYESPDFDTSDNRVILDFTVAAASVDVR